MRGKETVQILPAGARDRHGDPVGGAAAEVSVSGCVTWPRTSLEEGRGWITIDGLNLFIPSGQPLPTAKDRVRARGEEWAVEGTPAEYTGRGTIVTLEKRG